MTTNTPSQTPIFDQEEFDKMVKEGTKIWAGVDISRDASQAASIEKDDEFEKLLSAHEAATTDAHICGGDFGTGRKATAAYNELIAYIDAKLAQARHEAWCEGVNIDALREHNAELESRLAEIQRGASAIPKWKDEVRNKGIHESYEPEFMRREIEAWRALLASLPESDTSGLPG